MPKISLTPYTIRVTQKSTGNYVKLNNITGKDLFEILDNYLIKIKTTASVDNNTSKVIKLKAKRKKDRINCGILETGEFGYETEIFDTKANTVTYSKKSHEAELIPFYYLLYVPENRDEGVVILQRFKQFGIRNILLEDFTKYFNGFYDDYNISINPLVVKNILDQYFSEGRIMKIRFINYKLPKNLEDIFSQGDHKHSPGYLENVVSLRRGRSFSSNFVNKMRSNISKLLSSSIAVSDLTELQEIQNYDNIKLEVQVGPTRRVVNLGKISKIRYNEDVTNRVRVTVSGHPTFDSIDAVSIELLNSIKVALYGETEDVQ